MKLSPRLLSGGLISSVFAAFVHGFVGFSWFNCWSRVEGGLKSDGPLWAGLGG